MNREDWNSILLLVLLPVAAVSLTIAAFGTITNSHDVSYLQKRVLKHQEELRKNAQDEEEQIRQLREQIRQLQINRNASNHSPAKPEEQQ